MPTPVGPLGPDEIDPNDPDLWDWDSYDDDDRRRPAFPMWIRFTAVVIVMLFALGALYRIFG
jgi:hypothetical protein